MPDERIGKLERGRAHSFDEEMYIAKRNALADEIDQEGELNVVQNSVNRLNMPNF
ncbi:hypothetical protein [Moraxella caviae]|uniref:hypothetical protein n=1 Tax=Moraxella caviae TaxID=34060 RepID=UPI0013010906|nr:hypothetical protein [Moraxella caviae]